MKLPPHTVRTGRHALWGTALGLIFAYLAAPLVELSIDPTLSNIRGLVTHYIIEHPLGGLNAVFALWWFTVPIGACIAILVATILSERPRAALVYGTMFGAMAGGNAGAILALRYASALQPSILEILRPYIARQILFVGIFGAAFVLSTVALRSMVGKSPRS